MLLARRCVISATAAEAVGTMPDAAMIAAARPVAALPAGLRPQAAAGVRR